MPKTLVIKPGSLVDGTGRAPVERPVILVKDGRIEAVGPSQKVPAPLGPEVETIDAPELCALPGLVDTHVHLVFSAGENALRDLLADDDETLLMRAMHNAQVALAAGITTVRDCGGRHTTVLSLRNAINSGIVLGPRIVASVMPITTTAGHCYWLDMEADTAEEVRKAARTLHRMGADFYKVMGTGGGMTAGSNVRAAQYSVEELQSLVAEAKRLGKKVASHCHGTAGIRNAVAAGIDTVEHCSWLGATEGHEFDPRVAEKMVHQGTYAGLHLAGGYRLMQKEPVVTGAKQTQRETWLGRVECHRKMAAAGVKIIAGTDAGVSLVPLDNMVYDMGGLVHLIGLSPVAAIQAATLNAADALGLAGEIGTLEPGKRADLILVEGNPVQDIHDVRRVRWVLQDGKVVARDGMLAIN